MFYATKKILLFDSTKYFYKFFIKKLVSTNKYISYDRKSITGTNCRRV